MTEQIPSALHPAQGQVADKVEGDGPADVSKHISRRLDEIAGILEEQHHQLEKAQDRELKDIEERKRIAHESIKQHGDIIKTTNNLLTLVRDLEKKARDLREQRDKYRQERDEAREQRDQYRRERYVIRRQRDQYKRQRDNHSDRRTWLRTQRNKYKQELEEAREKIVRLTTGTAQDPVAP